MTDSLSGNSPPAITDRVDFGAVLMRRVAQGDTAAFADLHRHYRRRIYNQLFAQVGDHHAAEDLCQQVFLRVFLHRQSYVPSSRFTTWLFCITRRLGLNALRDRRRLRRRVTCGSDLRESFARALEHHTCCPRETPEHRLFRQERRARVSAALRCLPERQHTVVILQQFQQLGYHEIAQRLNVTPTAVHALLRRARKHLRRSLACEADPN